jgi:hypothetical protein
LHQEIPVRSARLLVYLVLIFTAASRVSGVGFRVVRVR